MTGCAIAHAASESNKISFLTESPYRRRTQATAWMSLASTGDVKLAGGAKVAPEPEVAPVAVKKFTFAPLFRMFGKN